MPWPKTGATHYHAQLGLPEKGRTIEELGYKLRLALGCYQQSLEVSLCLFITLKCTLSFSIHTYFSIYLSLLLRI